ncbi:DUF1304 domain-containing protein [Candidatus Enterococcus courvalinii]|uniref:DUF1304 domain-containing protein n=1 Tax=Candidatus Enterococcus courvalinii TaxID=2815329 RepID=A0ABS3HYU6_9ENTE|nr:DUF1304 domain-containing protein [Enterococcus sp. MSG2901]MBO0481596.1 DUF1304 domain-containing protein [Enterococcus sp. MSG2901]
MHLFSTIIITLVAIEFFYIMYLETFATTSATTGRVFHLSKEELARPSVTVLFKNQGIYNGLIGVGLLYATYVSSVGIELAKILLLYIILVALYGSITSDKKIIITQGGLAIIAFVSLFF